MKKILSLALVLMMTLSLMAQNAAVLGTVQDAQTSEPLVGVSVVEKGTTNGVITDLDGNFVITVPKGAELQLSYVGYATLTLKINKAGDQGVIEMESEAIGLEDVTVTGQMAIARKTPVAVSQVSYLEIEEKIGNQEFVEVLKNTPGVHPNKQGGGWGDSEIFMRGFSSENVGVVINGAPMNDMEWGGTYWSNWQGLSDVTTIMQTQRGLGASKISSPSVGGTINIVTKGIDAKKGGFMSYAMGNDGYNKVAFSVSTGLMKNGWAITVLGSRTWGDGYVQGTKFTGYTYFANISKRINDSHQLSLTAFGAPQEHFQRAASYGALTLAEYDKVKKWMTGDMHWTRYNPTYGFDSNGNMKSSSYNVYHKPQISLNHVWKIDYKSSLSTSAYVSIGRGYGYAGEAGAHSGYSYSDWNGASYGALNMNFRKADGTFDYAKIEEINAASEYGSALIMSKSQNYHNWVGLVSTYTNQFADCVDFYGGVDVRYFNATHTNVIVDLYGGDYYLDPSRADVKVENNKNAADPEWVNKKLGVGDVCYRDYDAYIVQEGLFAQAEYNKHGWSAFINGAINLNHYWRIDHMYYDEEHAKSERLMFLGGNIKGGFNYQINHHNNIFVNIGFISRAPKFNYGAFLSQTTSNAVNRDAKNEKIASAELGYSFHNEYVNVSLNGYFTEWMDKTMTKSGNLDNQQEYYMNMTGVNARHFGGELEIKARPTKWMELNAMVSLGSWKWDSDSVKGLAYDAHGNALRTDGTVTEPGADDQAYAIINMKGINVGGSAQTTANLGITFKPFKGFRIGAEYTVYDRNYAYYSFSGSNLTLGKTMNIVAPWKIPTGGSMDLRASYHFQIGKLDATLSGNVNNVLNQLYIEKAYNPTTASATAGTEVDVNNVYMFFTQGRTWSVRLKLNF
ncbi:MAG: carboxypeptidase-like regulatory domain-containing protein [Paludibacteraceae bacterium]|nr:carboxypeptidase-like regulatory domain-containing protein [Paludibacteraceae bacterium]